MLSIGEVPYELNQVWQQLFVAREATGSVHTDLRAQCANAHGAEFGATCALTWDQNSEPRRELTTIEAQ